MLFYDYSWHIFFLQPITEGNCDLWLFYNFWSKYVHYGLFFLQLFAQFLMLQFSFFVFSCSGPYFIIIFFRLFFSFFVGINGLKSFTSKGHGDTDFSAIIVSSRVRSSFEFQSRHSKNKREYIQVIFILRSGHLSWK